MKYYVVLAGKEPGIYTSWPEAKQQVDGYPGAIYKSFTSLAAARSYQEDSLQREKTEEHVYLEDDPDTYVAYTDGSFSPKSKHCGFGIVLLRDGMREYYFGRVLTNKCTNNVAELYAIWMLLSRLELPAHKKLIIYTDSRYSIQVLTTATMTATNRELILPIKQLMQGRKLELRHVEAHVGVKYNEAADQLANLGRESEEELALYAVVPK